MALGPDSTAFNPRGRDEYSLRGHRTARKKGGRRLHWHFAFRQRQPSPARRFACQAEAKHMRRVPSQITDKVVLSYDIRSGALLTLIIPNKYPELPMTRELSRAVPTYGPDSEPTQRQGRTGRQEVILDDVSSTVFYSRCRRCIPNCRSGDWTHRLSQSENSQ